MPAAHTSQQKNAIAEFTSVTQADKTVAAKFLKQANWNVGQAVNAYFNNPSGAGANPLRDSLSKTFDKLREQPIAAPDEISMDAVGELLGEMEIDLADIGTIVFHEIVQAPTLGSVEREGFVNGWTEYSADTVPKMRNVVLQRRSQLATDPEVFKSVYNYTFQLMLQERQKSVPMENAVETWRQMFTPPSFSWATASTPWLEWWIEYYESKVKKAVNRDLWKQTLNFAQQSVKDDSLSFWSEESSWPSVIDEFVAWVREEKRPGGEDAMDTA